jgi:heme-degrading monooxygenase HmoA
LHQRAKALGKKQWYQSYKLRIAVVEREYGFEAE